MTYPSEPDDGESEGGIKDDSEVDILLGTQLLLICRCVCVVRKTIDVLNGYGQRRVREHPECDQARTESLVLIVHCWLFNLILDLKFRHRTRDGLFEDGVEILLNTLRILYDLRIGILCFGRRNRRQRFSLIAPLGAP